MQTREKKSVVELICTFDLSIASGTYERPSDQYDSAEIFEHHPKVCDSPVSFDSIRGSSVKIASITRTMAHMICFHTNHQPLRRPSSLASRSSLGPRGRFRSPSIKVLGPRPDYSISTIQAGLCPSSSLRCSSGALATSSRGCCVGMILP